MFRGWSLLISISLVPFRVDSWIDSLVTEKMIHETTRTLGVNEWFPSFNRHRISLCALKNHSENTTQPQSTQGRPRLSPCFRPRARNHNPADDPSHHSDHRAQRHVLQQTRA